MTKPATKRRKKRGMRKTRPSTGLLPQEQRFVDAYIGEAAGNAREAARIAGYAGKPDGHAWNSRGNELLNRARVREAIDARRKELAAIQREMDERVRKEKIEELARKRAELFLGPILTGAELQRFWSGVVTGEITGFEAPQRMQAARDLAKSLGLFVEEKEIPPAPQLNDGEQPRVQVMFAYVDNGRGPRAPIDALPISTEDRKQ